MSASNPFTKLLLMSLTIGLTACAAQYEVRLPDDTDSEPLPQISAEEPAQQKTDFREPAYTADQAATILAKYEYVDPTDVVPPKALQKALLTYHANLRLIANRDALTVIDYARSSKEKRMHIINMKTGAVFSTHVSHGKGSDPNHDGMADTFSNTHGSNATSLGFYLAAETYQSAKHGLSLRMDGMSKTNSNARSRAVVIHGATYVQNSSVIQGRSFGCPAVAMNVRDKVVNALKGGSLIFATAGKIADTPAPTPPPTPRPSPPPTTQRDPRVEAAPLWEKARGLDSHAWTKHSFNVVEKYGSALLEGTQDVEAYCPAYHSLTRNQKVNFWVYLVSAMVKYESNFNPVSRMQETTMGTDPVTKLPVFSEGLLQLSYQDGRSYSSICNEFDWAKDKSLNPKDPKKTILDPLKNLSCGIRILNSQVQRKDLIAYRGGQYWAVIIPGGKYTKVTEIKSLTNKIPFCQE